MTSHYLQEISEWQEKRNRELRNPNGWLTLAGLYWLEEGRNSFGADPANGLIFPEKAPARLGDFVVTETGVRVEIAPNVPVTCDGENVSHLELTSDGMDGPVLAWGSLRWFVIWRGGRWAVRLRDVEHPALAAFSGVDYFPIDPVWRVAARLIPHPAPVTIPVPTVLGTVNHTPSPGILHFSLHGEEQRLIALEKDARSHSLIFADATSGKESYGSGRFLTVAAPDGEGQTFIDFNRAYNPPCAFTPFATCPLPPKGNRLALPITAGEKKYGDH